MAKNNNDEMLGGFLNGGVHSLPLRVYYEDTDFSGLVYHASYLRFMERGRTELLRCSALHQAVMHEEMNGLAFAVRRMSIEFEKPARMDDVLLVKTRSHEMRGASMVLAQEIWRDGERLVMAEVTVAAIRAGRAVRLPDELRRALSVS
jgi:acyl-CoA thioester hydrolase